MVDGQGRSIDYMRISVTDRCNLRCVYCMPKSGVSFVPETSLLTDDEIVRIVNASARAGIRHIKVTGGEPLLRDGITVLIRRIKEVPHIDTVSLTTNGILLPKYVDELYRAGISGVNISLDTLDEKRFRERTGGGKLTEALKGLQVARTYPDLTVKVNTVLYKEHWEEDVQALVHLAEKAKVHVRFIEHMPLGTGEDEKPVAEQDVLRLLREHYGEGKPCTEKIGEGPGHYFVFPGLLGRIGFISAMSHKFCSECNRIRLTADGNLRMCLQSREGVNLRERLRSGVSDEGLTELIEKSVCRKPAAHCMNERKIEAEGMCQIGG